MKKMIAIAAVTVMMTSCGGSSATEATTTDSVTVKADTAAVVDSTKVADTAKIAK